MSVLAVIHLAAEEGEHGHHPNGFWYGDINEVAWSSLAFLIVAYLLYRFALPAMKKGLSDRTTRIEHELAAAEASRAEAQAAGQRITAAVGNADQEAERIVADARRTAEAMKVQLRQRADEEAADLRRRAQADIEAAKGQAIADLRAEVSALALGAAEHVVRRNLDADTQLTLVESYIDQVGAGR